MGMQIAATQDHAFNHSLIFSVRVPLQSPRSRWAPLTASRGTDSRGEDRQDPVAQEIVQMNAQPLSRLSLDRATVGSRTDNAMASAAHAVDSSEPQAVAPPLSWKQRLFVVMLFLIALLLSFVVVCSIDPPAVVLYNSVRHAAARDSGSGQR